MRHPSLLSGPLPAVLAGRYLRGRSSRLLHRTALAALISVTLGVTAMVVAMALMTGYRQDLEEKLIEGNAAILAYPISPDAPPLEPALTALIGSLPDVTAWKTVAYGQGTLASGARPDGEAVTLRGVGPGPDALGGAAPDLGADARGLPGAVLGRDLAARLQVGHGDALRLVALGFEKGQPRFRFHSLRVGGTFASGFAEFDQRWVVLDRTLVGGDRAAAALLEVALEDPREAPRVAGAVEAVLGPDYLVTDWQELNRELFAALRLQKLLLFFLLGLIVVVSTFNVASTLMVLVRERLREVGVLSALGLDGRRLAATFLLCGGALGVVGVGLGVTLGAAISWGLTTFELVRFDAEVAEIYFISSVPFRVTLGDSTAVVAFTLLVILASSLFPALRVARVQAAEALRYE